MDVTEETQARAALQQTRRRDLAAQMTSGMAHDFSNLLTIILGLQGKLARLDGLPEGARDLIDGTLAATKRGGALLERIGDMTAARPYRARATDLAGFLHDLMPLARSTLPDGVALTVQSDVPDAPVLLDPGMLQDALLNLVLNARDACGASGTIVLTAQIVSDTWVELVVTDTGPGFSDSVLDRALEPFFTTKGHDGSGLGLPMVYDTVKLAGGDLQLGNAAQGARVSLRLPLRFAPRLDGGLVLLVEDRPDLRTDIRDSLTGSGHSVIEASAVDEARMLLRDVPEIDLVLSDLNLSGEETGVDLGRAVLEQGKPLILMTSLPPDDPLHQQARDLAPVLRKPFGANALTDLLAPETPS